MLTLYIREGCPYSARVLEVAKELGLTFDIRDIDDFGISDELKGRGGKVQTPYFADNQAEVEMYDSDAIIAYLHERFSDASVS